MQDRACLQYIQSHLDPLFVKQSILDILKECLHSVVQRLSLKERFSSVDARNAVEDSLEIFEERTQVPLASWFEKALSKKFVKHVKAASEIEPLLLADLSEAIKIDSVNVSSEVITLAIQKEVRRFLDVLTDVADFGHEWSEGLEGVLDEMNTLVQADTSSASIRVSHLETWASKLNIRGVLPLLAMLETTRIGTARDIFKKDTINQSFLSGIPVDNVDDLVNADKDFFARIRKAKEEPQDPTRLVIASNGHLLVQDSDSKSFVPLPEPLAHFVAVIPGLDLPEDRAMVFVADPKTSTGAIVYLRLFGPLKRIATFDLEVPPEENITFITSERDANHNVLLTWGSLSDEGSLKWAHHACILEDNLVQDQTFRRDTVSKLAFEDFGEPVDRLADTRQDFRDHGNRMTLQKSPLKTWWALANKTQVFELPKTQWTSIQGYPKSFFVSKKFKVIDHYIQNDKNGQLDLGESVSLDWPQAITSITVV